MSKIKRVKNDEYHCIKNLIIHHKKPLMNQLKDVPGIEPNIGITDLIEVYIGDSKDSCRMYTTDELITLSKGKKLQCFSIVSASDRVNSVHLMHWSEVDSRSLNKNTFSIMGGNEFFKDYSSKVSRQIVYIDTQDMDDHKKYYHGKSFKEISDSNDAYQEQRSAFIQDLEKFPFEPVPVNHDFYIEMMSIVPPLKPRQSNFFMGEPYDIDHDGVPIHMHLSMSKSRVDGEPMKVAYTAQYKRLDYGRAIIRTSKRERHG